MIDQPYYGFAHQNYSGITHSAQTLTARLRFIKPHQVRWPRLGRRDAGIRIESVMSVTVALNFAGHFVPAMNSATAWRYQHRDGRFQQVAEISRAR